MHTGRRLGLTAPRCVWVAEKHTLKVRSRLSTGVEGPAGALCHHHDAHDFVPHLSHDAVEQRTELRPPFTQGGENEVNSAFRSAPVCTANLSRPSFRGGCSRQRVQRLVRPFPRVLWKPESGVRPQLRCHMAAILACVFPAATRHGVVGSSMQQLRRKLLPSLK